MPDALADARAVLDEEDVEVAVSDLDGVLRVFDTLPWDALDARLGLEPGAAFDAILRDPILEDVTRGRAAHADWRKSIQRRLRSRRVSARRAADVVSAWAEDRGRLDVEVLDLLRAAQQRGLEIFVLTNGTDRVRQELEELRGTAEDASSHAPHPSADSRSGRRLDELLDPHGDRLLNTAELGEAKPDAAAFAAAHDCIERVLGRALPRRSVAFLDDSENHVRGARTFGWRAVRLQRS